MIYVFCGSVGTVGLGRFFILLSIGVNVIGFVLCFLWVGLGRFLAGLDLFLTFCYGCDYFYFYFLILILCLYIYIYILVIGNIMNKSLFM